MQHPSPIATTGLRTVQRLLVLLVAVLGLLVGTTAVASASTTSKPGSSSGNQALSVLETRVGVATDLAPVFVGSGQSVSAGQVGETCPRFDGITMGSCVATKTVAGACSFGGETRVLMADGSTKPISQVEAGDMVLAQDPETGEIGARRVTHTWVHDDDLVRLEIDGDVVRTTEDHPFWNDTDKQWQRADQLDTGDYVLTVDGRRVKVGVLVGSAGRGSAYNLTVEGIHTYHVLFGTDAVLVHNVCPTAEAIGNGHAFTKHVVGEGQFPGVRTRAQFAEVIDDVMTNADHVRSLSNGRTAFWKNGVVVIKNPNAADLGTAFVPKTGINYFWGLT